MRTRAEIWKGRLKAWGRWLRGADFTLQTILIGAGALAAGFAGMRVQDAWVFLLAAQYCLGWLQMVGALPGLFFPSPYRKHRVAHFFTAIIYLAILAMSLKNNSGYVPGWALVTFPAWALGLYYYWISWKNVFRKPASANAPTPDAKSNVI